MTKAPAHCLVKEKESLHEYMCLSKPEEAFLKQKARNQWLQLGDQNNASSLFHKMIKVRTSRNLITHLWDEQGVKVEDEVQIKKVAVEFYQNLLGESSLVFYEKKAAWVS